MDVIIAISLSQRDFMALKQISNGVVSDKIREILDAMTMEELEGALHTSKTTCRVGLELASKVQEAADKLGVQPGRVARAAIETYLHKHH
jgi:hypothetical protein